MMRWRPFHHEGKRYDLSHLHPIPVVFVQPPSGDQPERSYDVVISFGLHCFTRLPEDGEDPLGPLLYSDNRERRQFDFRRYQLSFHLPAIVKDLPSRTCYHAKDRNFFCIEVVDHEGLTLEYDVFFVPRLYDGRLNILVQSAYPRDPSYSSNRPRAGKVGLFVILFNTLRGRPIRLC